jgi:ubiquinol-cytochrome c reductase cytochrome b subunit
MRNLKNHPLLRLLNSYLVDSPQPSNISYLWNFGSLLAVCLVIQIITGVTLAMHYNANVLEAFNSIEHIMRDVNNGWLDRYLHSNTASAFFFLVYLHIGRGLYYGSYKFPRTLTWFIGTVILILMMATAFLGYVLPYGQMSLWGATVITNLISAIPWIGQDVVEFIWGGFSVNNATLNRFFSLHYLLPFILAALVLMHLISFHDTGGSNNPLGTSGNYDRLSFSPYFLFKDLVTIFILILILSMLVFFTPNLLGDSENYIMANPMQTPPAIVPEWYLLPFYAILRSIPNKLLGVIAMFSAILTILILPITDLSKLKGLQFKPFNKLIFWIFTVNFLVLMWLGAKHVESPFIELGQITTILFFGYFIVIFPVINFLFNSLLRVNTFMNNILYEYNNSISSGKNKFSPTPRRMGDPLGTTVIAFTVVVPGALPANLVLILPIAIGMALGMGYYADSLLHTVNEASTLSAVEESFRQTGNTAMINATNQAVATIPYLPDQRTIHHVLAEMFSSFDVRTFERFNTNYVNQVYLALQNIRGNILNDLATPENLNSMYVHLQQLITAHENLSQRLSVLVNNAEGTVVFEPINRVFEQSRDLSHAILEVIRFLEDTMRQANHDFISTVPHFWFE